VSRSYAAARFACARRAIACCTARPRATRAGIRSSTWYALGRASGTSADAPHANATRAVQRLLDVEPWSRDVEQAYAFVLDRVCAEMDANPPIDTFVALLDLTVRVPAPPSARVWHPP
jgi:hypothetical protein